MNHIIRALSVVAACLFLPGCAVQDGRPSHSAALSENLDAWQCYLADPNVRVQDVWRVQNGVLICSGNPLGYLYTKQDYRDFVLRLQWRWPDGAEPGKGGVLIRMTGQHKVWPRSLEAQLNAGQAGDFWGLAGYELSGPAERTQSIDNEKFGRLTNVKKAKALEKPPGQWNTYEIIAQGDTVTLAINGEQVNKATGCALDSGKICLTSEGSEIHFRNIEVAAPGPQSR